MSISSTMLIQPMDDDDNSLEITVWKPGTAEERIPLGSKKQ